VEVKKMKNKKAIVFLMVIIVTVVISVWTYYQNSLVSEEEKNYIEGSGIIEGESIVVSSKLAGQLEKMYVDEGDIVKKGEIIARLSSKQIEAKVKQAEARLELANAQVKSSEAALEALGITASQTKLAVDLSQEEVANRIKQTKSALQIAEANLKQVQIAYNDAKKDYDKYLKLYNDGAMTLQQFEKIKSKLNIAKSQYEAAQNEVARVKAALELAKTSKLSTQIHEKTSESTQKKLEQAQGAYQSALAQKKLAQAVLEEAQAVLEDTIIKAPTDGRITLKIVNEGELISQGTPIVEIIDLSKLNLTLYVPEKQIGKVKLGQEADIYIDSFADKAFRGKVIYISDKAEFTPKNVHMKEDRVKLVYGVKVRLEDTVGIMKPGMPADAVIRIKNFN
jgi:HlyD family secretion protein